MSGQQVPALGARQIFIGRGDEIALLQARLDDCRAGRGSLVLLAGPPGIGKSRLTSEFADLVGGEGIRALVGRSWEAGGAPAYWPWVQAIRVYLRAADPALLAHQIGTGRSELAALLPEVADTTTESSPSASPAADRFRLFDSAATFLRNVADTVPVVIVLEDLQAADVPSLLLLQFVTEQIARSRILIIGTYRDVEVTRDHPLAPILAELHRAPVTTAITLSGLDVAEVTRFVEATSGNRATAAVARMLHGHTSGNPLFLGEAVRLLTSDSATLADAAVTRLAVPAEIRAVIERRLGGLADPVRNALQVGSVYGNEFEMEWVRRLAGGSTDEMLEFFGSAVNAGLAIESTAGPGRFRFSHDLIRHTLYAGLPPVRRIELHRRAAEILEGVYAHELDAHLAELALHHFEAAPGGDTNAAADMAIRAGDQAMRSLAYEEAVRLYQMALHLTGAEPSNLAANFDLLHSLGDARVRAGDLPGAGDAFLRAAEVARRLGDARRLAQAAAAYGGRFVWSRAGSDTQMVPLLQDALVMLGGEDDALRVRLLSRLACALRSTADGEHLDALSRQALELARQIGDPHSLIYALTGRAGAIWTPENPAERLAIGDELVAVSERVGSAEGVMDGHMTRCVALGETGDLRGARRELELITAINRPLRLPAQRWLEVSVGALFALLRGSLSEVEPAIEEILLQGPTTPARDNVSAARFQLFLLRREQGRLGEIEAIVRSAADEFPWYPLHRVALAYLLCTIGRREEGRQVLAEVSESGFALVRRDNYWLTSLCLAAEVAVALDDRETGKVLYELLEPYSARHAIAFPEGSLGSVARYLGLLAALSGHLDEADARLGAAEALDRASGARPWLAHTLYDRARVETHDREVGVLLDESLALCLELGLVALQQEVELAREVLESGQVTATVEARPNAAAESVMFRREGEYFSVGYAGDHFRLRDSKGLRYLAVVLGSPGREIHVLDLVAAVGGADPTVRGGGSAGLDATLGAQDAGPVLDRQARGSYERRIRDLEEEIEEARAFGDSERAASARDERDFLVTELAAALGLGGRDRAAVSVAERARVNVTRAIRSALGRISDHSRSLGDHLEVTIHTGTFCSYTPDPRAPASWEF